MAVATGASISGFSALRQSLLLPSPPTASFRPNTQRSAAVSTNNQSTTSESPTNRVFPNGKRTFQNNSEGVKIAPSTSSKKVLEEEEEGERLSVKDYFEQTKVLIESSGGNGNGRPRWFSPLECGARIQNSPLLIYLPGIDGVGLGLILQYQKLGKIFDIWCLHIPAKDRTPFQELVLLVEEIIRSENQRAPDRPIYLVGESIGGCLALSVAARNPDIDLVLILANPATCYNKSQLQALQTLLEVVPSELSLLSLPYTFSLMTGEPLKLALSIVNKEPVLEHTLNQLFRGISELSSYLSVLADVLPRDTLLWKLQLMKSASSFANSRLHAVKAQILILASGQDPLLPNLEEAERIRGALPKQEVRVLASTGEMPKCDIRKFNDSGHFLFLEDDVDLVTIIKGVSFYRRSRSRDYVSDYLPPTESEFKKTVESFRWIKTATDPVMLSTLEDGKIVRGLGGIPDEGPVLFVGYHMLMGVEIYPLVMDFMEERNILLRGVAHPMLFTKLRNDAMDLASFDAYRIMGGMREALHKKGEAYQLFWPESSEFVRMAARFGAKIIPFGVVGEDDVFELVADYEDQMRIPILRDYIENGSGQAIRLRDESQGEVANQVGYLPGLLPKLPGRFYFLFGKPIDTAGMKQELRDREEAHKLYLHVKSEVERNISYLKEKREKDPYRSFAARTLYQATHGWTSEIPTFEL